MPAAEWYKNQKDRLKRALRAQKQSSASLPDLSNTPLQPNPAPHWQSGINPTDKGPEDTLRPLSSVIALNDSSTVVPTLQSPRNPAIATSVKPLPDLVVAHKDSPTAKKTTAAALGPPLNELQKVETQSKSNWSGLKTLLHTLSSGALTGGFGPLELAIGGLDRCIGIFEQASRSRDDFCELGEKLNQLLGDLAQFNDAWVGSAMTASVKNLCSGIEAELRIVEQKQGRNAPERYIEATEDLDTILECYRRICGYVERLMLNANLNMWKILDEEITDKRMLQLSPSMSGAYNSWAADRTKRRQCTEGTRVAELEKLNDWVRDSSGSAIYWINGMAAGLLPAFSAHTGSSLALSANGSQFVSASSDGSICIWDTQARQLDQVLGSRSILTPSFDGEVTQAIFSPDNKYIASCDCSAILLWEAGSRKLVTVMVDQRMEPVTSISFSPDSSRLLSCTRKGTVYVWSISIRPPDVDHYVIRRKAERVHCACFSSDGSQIVTGTHNGSVWLWDVDSGKLAMSPLTGHEGRICSVAISSDGAYVASASSDKTIRLWDIKEAKGSYKVLEKHTKRQDILMFTSDNQQLLYGPLVYQVATSPFTLELETGSESALHHGRDEWGGEVSGYNKCCIASSPDGLYVASGSAEGTIRMWRAQTSQVVMGPIWGHSNSVSRILFSPNREHMVSFSLDDVMCFWPIPSESSRKDTSPHALGPDKQTGNPTSLSPHRKFNKSGWIVNDQDEHLIWVPRDLQPYLLRPGADQLISHRGSFEVDFTGANIGELWTRCYRPG
ncbi:unnamed protein product [Rhizoctonia solani]|uniref:Vegetative incompatibility protein HET-E-1 n=1 Tax=Rhizoctonia solani TaxID=456999 RepID=A0A8H3DRQ1_9AGAM|nr:unnamed protein product [Rhizoctonia solani]